MGERERGRKRASLDGKSNIDLLQLSISEGGEDGTYFKKKKEELKLQLLLRI